MAIGNVELMPECKVPVSMAIGNVELMPECFPKRSLMNTVRMK